MFEYKSVWHSSLVQVSDTEGIRVKFTGKPRPSKYDGKPDFVGFELENGDKHLLNCEQGSNVAEYLTENIRENEWCILMAFSRGDAATVDLLYDEASDTLPQEAPAATDSLPPATEWPDEPDAVQGQLENQSGPRTVDDVYLASFLRAFNLEKRFTKETGVPLTENVRCIATSLRIDSK